jgi:transcriptional regulator with XRE-family HTH domain
MRLKLNRRFLEVRQGTRYVGVELDEWRRFIRDLRKIRALLGYISKFTRVRNRSRRTQFNKSYKLIQEHEFLRIQRFISNMDQQPVLKDSDFIGFYHAIRDRDTQQSPPVRQLGRKLGVNPSTIAYWMLGTKTPSKHSLKKVFKAYPKIAKKFFPDPYKKIVIDVKAVLDHTGDSPYRMAKKLGAATSTVYFWLNHGVYPNETYLRRIIQAYGQKIRDILIREEDTC